MIIIPDLEIDEINNTTKVELSLVKCYKPWLNMVEDLTEIVSVNLITPTCSIQLDATYSPCSTLVTYSYQGIFKDLLKLEVITNDKRYHFNL